MERRWAIIGLIAIVAAFVGAGALVLRSELTAEDDTRAPGAWEIAWQYLAAFDDGKAAEAAKLTDDPVAARATLRKIRSKLPDATVVTSLNNVQVNGSRAVGEIDIRWTFEESRTFSYGNEVNLTKQDGQWLVDWTPALVHPDLKAGQHLAMVTRTDAPAVLDAHGKSLMVWGDIGPEPVKPGRAKLLQPAMLTRAQAIGVPEKWAVAAVNAKGKRVRILDGVGPKLPKPIKTTLDVSVQDAAQAAVDTQGKPAALVAFKPSSGSILAIAQNGAADQGPIALSGLYPPGSAFELVTATAALTDGSIPAHAEGFDDIGTDIPGRTVVTAANQLGLNADFAVPGIETEAGAVRLGIDAFQQAEVAKGQGEAKVSPFGMALMSATIASGEQVTPKLWPDQPTRVLKKYPPPQAAVLEAVRRMMRMEDGVHGKTGTSNGGQGITNSWFTAYRDDMAFAVLVDDGGSARPAKAVAERFLAKVR